MIEIRKLITTRETVFSELGVEEDRPTTRAVGMAVIRNPFAGQFVEDLRPLFEAGAMLGERLMPELVKLLDGPAVSYGKGAIVGVAGEMEHGGACVHPMLGKPMRAAIGGGKAVIGSNVKVAAAGAVLDVPLGHKDDSWSFPHFDTITVSIVDAPRPDEILVVMAIADGGRFRNRCGTEPIWQTANSEPGIRRGVVAPGFLGNPEVRRWLNGVEPAWTMLDFDSFNALHDEPSASNRAICLEANLTASEISGSVVTANALILLRRAADTGGLKLTATGNLSRAVVEEMLDRAA